MSVLKLFFWILHSLFLPRIIFYFFVSPIRFLLVFYFFIFSKHCFNSSSFHSVFLISFYLFSFYTRLITILSLLRIVENYDFDIISRFRISDSEFRLVSALSILCFVSSTLYLFNSSACYKQTSMLMQSLFYAYFGYFKAFWRVFTCFRCSLSSWDKIMRQKA